MDFDIFLAEMLPTK